MTKTTTNRPSHTAYIGEGEGDKANWTEFGALWAHEDGKGFNLSLKAPPLTGRLVIRQRKERDASIEPSDAIFGVAETARYYYEMRELKLINPSVMIRWPRQPSREQPIAP